jgi:hypothetical protein
MRELTFDDVKIVSLKIVAAPAWAYDRGWPIEAAWRGLLEELEKRRAAAMVGRAAEAEEYRKIAADPEASAQDRYVYGIMATTNGAPPWKGHSSWPVDVARSQDPWRAKPCVVCRTRFFGVGRTSTCTDRCAKIRRDSTRTRGEAKPVEREPKACERCGERFIPPRSDARFCTVRCRVAHHRARSG